MASAGMLRRVALVRTDVSEEFSASFIRMTNIGELGTTLNLTRNRRSFQSGAHCNETHRDMWVHSTEINIDQILGHCRPFATPLLRPRVIWNSFTEALLRPQINIEILL
jgi:hypothetical protein